MKNVSAKHRKMFLSFVVAGTGAVFAEHFLKPKLKGKLKV